MSVSLRFAEWRYEERKAHRSRIARLPTSSSVERSFPAEVRQSIARMVVSE